MAQSFQTMFTGLTVARPVVIVPPSISGLQVWTFFGNDATGQAGNLVNGGPTLTTNGAGVSSQPNNTGLLNPGGVFGGLDTTIPRASLLAGFSLMWASVSSSGLPGAIASDSGGNAFACSMQLSNTDQANAPTISFSAFGSGIQPSTEIVTGDQSVMKLYAMTWGGNNGGAGSALTGYDLTDSISGATAAVVAVSPGVSTFKIGASATGVISHQIALSFWMLSTSVLSGGTLTSIAASVRTLLNGRGFTTV